MNLQRKEFDEKLRIFSFSGMESLKWVVEADSATLQQVVGVLTTKMESRGVNSFAYFVAITGPSLLCMACMAQVCQVLRSSTALQIYAASDGWEREWFFTLYWQKAVSPMFLNGSKLLQSAVRRKKRVAMSILLQ